MVKKATTKKGTTAGTATKGTRPPREKGAGNAEPPQRKPVRQRRRGDYDYAQDGKTRTGSLPGDLTIKPSMESKVQVVRPDFDHGDSLIFRPLPCLEDTDENQANCKWSSYRRSIDPFQFSDFMRSYPATKYVGTTDDRFTFLLYDKARARQEGYDKKQNPYILLYNTIANAKKKRTLPNMDWLQLLEGKDSFLGRPTNLYFLQGLIFKRGEEMYVGGGRSPRGAGAQDKPQIIQLSSSAGQALERMMNEVNADFTGNPEHWENSMIHGDVVAPKFGRFIRVQNPKKLQGQANTNLEGLDSWQMGGDAHEQQGSIDDNFRGYTVSVDDVFISGGRRTKLKPKLTPEQSKALKSTIQWWDEILYVPETDELCLIIAKALRAASAAIEFAWQDHPDYLTGDVQKVLANATQVLVAGPVGTGQDLEFDEMANRGRQSGVVPTEEEAVKVGADDGSYSEGYDESDEYGEDEAGAEAEVGESEPEPEPDPEGEVEPDEQTWAELGGLVDSGGDPDHALEKSMEEACGVYEIVSNDYAKWQGLGVKLDELDAEATAEVKSETAGDDGGGYDEEYANTEPEASVEEELPTVEGGEYEGEYEADVGTVEAAAPDGDKTYEFEEDFPDANEGNQEAQDGEEASMSEAFAAADSRSSKRGGTTKKTTPPKKNTPKKTVSKKPPVKKGAKGKKAKGKKKS